MNCDPAFVPNSPRFAALANRLREKSERESEPRPMYQHIAVPIDTTFPASSAIRLAQSLANCHGAQLTLLQIIPDLTQHRQPLEPPSIANCLDAIDRLHEALPFPSESLRRTESKRRHHASKMKLQEFLNVHFPDQLRRTVDVRMESRRGDFVSNVTQFCHAEAVDLLILSGRLSWWGLPIVPARIRQLLRLAKPPVIVVPPQMST